MIEPQDKSKYSALIAQYMSEIHTLIYKLDKLNDECGIIFSGIGIVDVIYHLEDAESCCNIILEDLNFD
jgi:hypothetical protein